MEETTSFSRHTMRWGLIIGILSIILTVLVYMIQPTLLVKGSYGFVVGIIFLLIIIYAGIEFRRESGGFISFGKAFRHSFMVFLYAGIIGLFFSILLFHVIDTGLRETLIDESMIQAEERLQRFGVPEDQMDEQLEQQRTWLFTPKGYAIGLVIQAVFWAIFSLIAGAVVKKRNPEEEL